MVELNNHGIHIFIGNEILYSGYKVVYVRYMHISLSQLACNITPAALLGDIAVVSLVPRLERE